MGLNDSGIYIGVVYATVIGCYPEWRFEVSRERDTHIHQTQQSDQYGFSVRSR